MSKVRDNPTRSRYELEVGDKLAIADYRKESGRLVITHVEVPPELRGGGIAGQVMAGVVASAQAQGLTIIPVCPYAVSYLKRHPI